MNPEVLALSIVILLFSVIVHEVMHGLMALKFGDHTAQRAGRLTLNPLPHIDPIGTILLPLTLIILPLLTGIRTGFFIGWAKPVPVNPLNFSDMKRGELFVSLAGIAANLGLAVIAAVLYHLLSNIGANYLFIDLMRFTVSINLSLAVFNLLPIPPLDGSKALMAILPYNLARSYSQIEQYGVFILLALLYFNIVNVILRLILDPLYLILGIPPF